MNETPDPTRLREYLLDRLPEAEAAAIELDLIADDRSFELFVAVEEELIDDYVRNALSPEESSALLAYLERLPDGPERVRFASALSASSLAPAREELRPHAPAARGLRRLVLPAAAAAVLLVSIVSGMAILQLSHHISELESDLSATRKSPAEAPRASFLLSSGALRGGGTLPQVAVSRADELIELRLDLAADTHGHYRATLRDVDGEELLSIARLTALFEPDRLVVSFLVPGALLAPGDYSVALEGTSPDGASEALARFDFRAVAK